MRMNERILHLHSLEQVENGREIVGYRNRSNGMKSIPDYRQIISAGKCNDPTLVRVKSKLASVRSYFRSVSNRIAAFRLSENQNRPLPLWMLPRIDIAICIGKARLGHKLQSGPSGPKRILTKL